MTQGIALGKQRARQLTIQCNSQPHHSQYHILYMHCSPVKVIFSFISFSSFLLFLSPPPLFFCKNKRITSWKAKEICKKSVAFKLFVSGSPDIFKLEFCPVYVMTHPASWVSYSCLISSNLLLNLSGRNAV